MESLTENASGSNKTSPYPTPQHFLQAPLRTESHSTLGIVASSFVATSHSCCVFMGDQVHSALGNSKCENDIQPLHCQTNDINESGFEFRDSPSVIHCGLCPMSYSRHKATDAYYFSTVSHVVDLLFIVRHWSSSVLLRFVLYTACAVLEQCKMISACGVSVQLSLRQVLFRSQLLQMVFRRNQYLKHNYVAVSDQVRRLLNERLSLCYINLSCHLPSMSAALLNARLFSFASVFWNHSRQKGHQVPSCNMTSGHVLSHTNDCRGGHGRKKCSTAEFLSDFVEAQGQQVHSGETYHFVDHTDDVGLLAYSKDTYVVASIPLTHLLTQVTVSQARALVKRHNILWGARDSMSAIKSQLDHHNGLCCIQNKSVFKLTGNKMRGAEQQQHLGNSPTLQQDSFTPEFPPTPLDQALSKKIIERACNRLKVENIGEKGCAVCGELKPVRDMSRLKSVKNQLHTLAARGVTRVERKTSSEPLRDYKGPILDYNCNTICDSCRGSIRKGKTPKLALANGLWIGDVPPQLKCLNFIERMLVAHIRHTCSYVKVASGMRKMTANVVAFQSPVPKIYSMLPRTSTS